MSKLAFDSAHVKFEELSYQLDDLTLTALACGNKEHQPVLCLHGYLDNAASFIPLMQQADFLPNKYVIALDWAGHGHSEHRSKGAHYHFFDYVSDLVSLFTHNNWPAIDIVSHSMGGMIASAFAAAFPEKVKSLTLIDSLGFICSDETKTTEQLRLGLLSRVKKNTIQRAFTEETAIKARLLVSDLKRDDAKIIIRRSLVKTEAPLDNKKDDDKLMQFFCWSSDPRLRKISPYRLTLGQAEQLLRDIKCPLKLIYGEQGMDMVLKGLSRYSSLLRNFDAVKIVGGHHVHMEQPQLLCKIVNDFHNLNKIKTSV